MKISHILSVAALVMLVGILAPNTAQAQIPEYSTVVFTEPTEVSGTVLQPGQYLIRVLPGFSNRQRVQITNMDRSEIYTTVLTVPRPLEPNEEVPNTMLVYYPSINGEPRVLRRWYAPEPAMDRAHDFVYEESRARLLARAANDEVIAYRGTVAEDQLDTTELWTVNPDATVETWTYNEPTTTTTTTRTTQIVEERPVMVAETRTTRTELPATGSKMPLIALLGFVAVAGALALRVANR